MMLTNPVRNPCVAQYKLVEGLVWDIESLDGTSGIIEFQPYPYVYQLKSLNNSFPGV